MKRLALLLLAFTIAMVGPFVMGSHVFPSFTDKDPHDGIGDDSDLTFLLTSTTPGNLDLSKFHQIYWSPDAGGYMVEGSDSNDDRATFYAPLETAEAVKNYIVANGSCRILVWMDSGDVFDGPDWGDATADDNGLRSMTLDCEDDNTDDPAIVFAGYPYGSRATWDFAYRGGPSATASNPVQGTAASPASSTTLVSDLGVCSNYGLADDDLIGGRVIITGESGGTCNAGNDHQVRDITDNDCTANTITVDAFPNDLDFCTYAVVSTSVTTSDVTTGAFEHVSSQSGNDGNMLFIGIDVYNAWEWDTFSAVAVRPSIQMSYWGVMVHSEVDWDVNNNQSPDHFHMNEPNQGFYVQSGCTNSNRICLNTSGNVQAYGNIWASSPTSDETVQGNFSRGLKHFEIGGIYDSRGTTGTFYTLRRPGVDGGAAAGVMETTFINTYFMGQGGAGDDLLSMQALATQEVSDASLRILYSTFHTTAGSHIEYSTAADGLTHNIFMRNVMFYGNAGGVGVLNMGGAGDYVFDIQYTLAEEAGSTPFFVDPDGNTTIALARADLSASQCATGDCAEDFFGPSTFTPNITSGDPSEHGANTVRDGRCLGTAPGNEQCTGAAVGAVTETIPTPLDFPEWALPSGEKIRTWHLYMDPPTKGYDIGAD